MGARAGQGRGSGVSRRSRCGEGAASGSPVRSPTRLLPAPLAFLTLPGCGARSPIYISFRFGGPEGEEELYTYLHEEEKKKKLIDTEVESAMRSNSGEKKKKKLSKGRGGRGDEERRRRGGKKKTHCEPRTTFFFFLKRKTFESARQSTSGCRRPFPGPRGGWGRGAPLLSACECCSVTSLIPHSSGFLLLCCYFSFLFFFW